MLSDSERIDARTLAPFIGSAQPGGRGLQVTEVAAQPHTQSQAPGATAGMPDPASWSDAMAAFEKRFLSDALRANGGRVIDTASQIGMGRATLYKKIAAYGIEV
jgi:DNA-binding NtrC family response regulator